MQILVSESSASQIVNHIIFNILFLTLQTNFLQSFSSLKPLKSSAHLKHRSITRGVTLCWLNLLVSVTFFTDGQQGVVKTPGAVEVLLELSGAQNKQLQEKALLVLRNLCFHGASRPVLLVNGEWKDEKVTVFLNIRGFRSFCVNFIKGILRDYFWSFL